MADRIDKPRELYLVAFDIWLPNLPHGERRVKTMIKRGTFSADRQVRAIGQWPYAAHLLALLRTTTDWQALTAAELAARAKELRDARTNEPAGLEDRDDDPGYADADE